jgi:hypothetical protein
MTDRKPIQSTVEGARKVIAGLTVRYDDSSWRHATAADIVAAIEQNAELRARIRAMFEEEFDASIDKTWDRLGDRFGGSGTMLHEAVGLAVRELDSAWLAGMNTARERDEVRAELASAKAVVEALVNGCKAWARDVDGIHPDCWDAYSNALALLHWVEDPGEKAGAIPTAGSTCDVCSDIGPADGCAYCPQPEPTAAAKRQWVCHRSGCQWTGSSPARSANETPHCPLCNSLNVAELLPFDAEDAFLSGQGLRVEMVPRSAVQAALDAMPRCARSDCERPARMQHYDQEACCLIHAGLGKAWRPVEYAKALDALGKALGPQPE